MEIETDMKTVQADPVQVNMEQGEVKTEQAESSVKHSKNKFKQAAVKTDESANGTDHKNGTSEDSKMETEEPSSTGHGREQGHFTSEIYKIELGPIPKMIGYGEVKSFLMKKHKIRAHKIKYLKHIRKCYVTFKNEKDREHAIETLNGEKLKKETLIAKRALPAQDKMVDREDRRGKKNAAEEEKKPDLRTTTEKLLDAVAPWRKIDYEKQVRDKRDKAKSNCVKITSQIRQAVTFTGSAVKWPREKYNSRNKLSFRVLECIESAVIWDYRNKCEFTFGYNGEKDRSVGFRIGRYKDSTVQVESAKDVPLLMPPIRAALAEIEQFIKNSAFEPYSPVTYEGHWTTVTMRCGGSDTTPAEDRRVTATAGKTDLVAIFIFTRNSLSDERLQAAKDELDQLAKESKTMTGVVFVWKEVRGTDGETTLLSGSENIVGTVLDKTFHISPMSFFQTHYHQCRTLYQVLGEWSTNYTNKDQKKVLLDICCGTGSIGIALADYFDSVFGVEMVESAIEDASKNVKLNQLEEKCKFILGKAEDRVIELCQAAAEKKMEIVAIVDPARAGLPKKVISVLRASGEIESLVYVSCDSSNKLAQGNIVDLCRDTSKSLRGSPFRVVKAQPIDMFPHTPHFELVVLLLRGEALKRYEEEERLLKPEPAPETETVETANQDTTGPQETGQIATQETATEKTGEAEMKE